MAMGSEAARLFVTIDAQVGGAVRGVQQVDTAIQHLANSPAPVITPRVNAAPAMGALGKLKAMMGGGGAGGVAGGLMQGLVGGLVGGATMAMATAGIAAVGTAVTGLVSGMVSGASQMEKYTVQLEVLLGSTKAAQQRIEELRTFANFTPFELPEVVEASKTLQVFTKGALATGAGLTLVGDIASGTGMQFGEAAMWMGRMYDALQSGRPIGEAAMRLQEVGALSGESRGRLEALAEAVKKGAKTGSEAWKEAAGEFSRYSGMMVKQSATMEGKASTLSDAWNSALTKMGTLALPALKAGIDLLTASVSLLDFAITGLTLPFSGKTWEGVPATLEGIAAGTDKITNGIELNAAAWQSYANSVQNWSYIATGTDPVREKLAAGLQQSATIVRQTARDMTDDVRSTLLTAAPKMFAPIVTGLADAVERAKAKARQTPAELAEALLSDIGRWKAALNALNTVTKESLSKGAKVGFLLAALNSKSIADGLASKVPEIREQTRKTVDGFLLDLVAMQGPAWTAAYNFGNAQVRGLAAGLAPMMNVLGGMEVAMSRTYSSLNAKPVSATSDAARSGAKAYADLMRDLNKVGGGGGGGGGAARAVAATREQINAVKASMVELATSMLTIPNFGETPAYKAAVKAYAGLAAASKLTGDAGEAAMLKITTALDKANTAAAAKITAIQKALSDLKASLSTWPAMASSAILGALDKVLKKLTDAWASLDAQQKANEIQAAASEVARAALVAAQPANVQAKYAEIDAATADVAKWMAEADKHKAGSAEQREDIERAVAAQVLLDTLTKEVGEMIEANTKAANDLAAALERVAEAQRNVNQATLEATEGYVGPTPVEQAANDLAAANAALVAAQAAVAALTPVVATVGAGTTGGTQSTLPGAMAGAVIPPILGTTGATQNTIVNATVNVTGPTLDPYGDFATRLAAALIPGLQRELARQGINL